MIALLLAAFVAINMPVLDARPKNVILMISDGFGPASETFGREYMAFTTNNKHYTAPLDEILVGQSRTKSSSSLVTDSAAGATAFSCGIKTYNAAIGVDDAKRPCATVLELAKKKGMLTGLVATSRVTHATPASFAAHVENRDMESEIAEQEIRGFSAGKLGDKPSVDLMIGGGRCFFIGSDSEELGKTCRKDGKDLWKGSKKYGWTALSTRKEFDKLVPEKAKLPLMALFTPGHMNYDIDRDPSKEPSLKEMAIKAIDILEKKSKDKGFFLMIEGSRIDMAAHSNDPAGHLRDILAYHETIAAVKDYVNKYKSDTVMISVSDHETGGMTLGRQVDITKDADYFWRPETLKNIHKSTDAIMKELLGKTAKTESVLEGAGLEFTKEEKDKLSEIVKTKNEAAILAHLSAMESTRARIGWTTTGHSGVDVNLYAYGENSQGLRGSNENTDIGKFIFKQLGIRRWKQKP